MATVPDGNSVGVPEDFVDKVRDALLHLYAPAALQTHPLLTYLGGDGCDSANRRLRQALLDAVNALQPGAEDVASPYAWRSYRLLELRYVEENDVAEVMELMALSKSQYHREHNRALDAVASLLWEKWNANVRTRGNGRVTEIGGLVVEIDSCASRLLDASEVLQSVEQLLRPLSLRRSTSLHVEYPAKSPVVRGDRVTLRQIFLILFAGAVEAVRGGRVAARLRAEQGQVTLSIAVGRPFIDDATRAKLSPFLTALGAGLEESEGEIRLTFPAAHPAIILVVDNSPDFVTLVERYLHGTTWSVVGALTVDEAYAVAREQRPAVVLLDIVIPGRDGWELLVDLKRTPETREIPVIVCSILADPEFATSLGAAACLSKPIDRETLRRTLEGIQGKREVLRGMTTFS